MTTTYRMTLTRIATLLIAVWIALSSAGCATAHSEEQAQGWSRAELEQLLAPVALYPDPLLAQLLIAATYPDEIVEAARWSRMHPEISGEEAMRAADPFDWDPSVKSLIAFPDLLYRMDEKIDWTRALGDAFLAQEDDVMDAVQSLRRRARLAGSLSSDAHVLVAEDGPRIRIVFASPSVIFVPYYDPRVAYGRWWWPTHPPVVWAPWPGYRFVPHAPGVTLGFWWNTGVRVSIGFFFGGIDWPRREVQVVRVDSWYVRHAIERRAPHRKVVIAPGRWRHEPTRRYVEQRHATHALPRPAPQRESRRAELRQPDARRPEVRTTKSRRTEERRGVVRQPEPRQIETRRPVVQPQEARRPVEQRAEGRQPEARRPVPRHSETAAAKRKPDRPEASAVHNAAPPAAHSSPQREARTREAQRGQQERTRTPRREAQAPSPPVPQREAQPQNARRADPRRDTSSAPQRSRAAERHGPRGSESGSQNADDTRERRPQG
ncbi:MAG: DUF3300 domain-containing protein [Betaproteobacteria bacterium]|nr:DUF3300 domain-containing protein [Betaproteobacteria bacterium]